jgi:hypothetical protein
MDDQYYINLETVPVEDIQGNEARHKIESDVKFISLPSCCLPLLIAFKSQVFQIGMFPIKEEGDEYIISSADLNEETMFVPLFYNIIDLKSVYNVETEEFNDAPTISFIRFCPYCGKDIILIPSEEKPEGIEFNNIPYNQLVKKRK